MVVYVRRKLGAWKEKSTHNLDHIIHSDCKLENEFSVISEFSVYLQTNCYYKRVCNARDQKIRGTSWAESSNQTAASINRKFRAKKKQYILNGFTGPIASS